MCSSAVALSAGADDNTVAFTKLLESCAGHTLRLPAGTFMFRPSSYAQGFTIPTGTTLEGAEGAATVLKVADSGTFASLLWIRSSRVKVRNLRLEGSHYDSGCAHGLDYGHAINVYSDTKDPGSIEDITISGNVFLDFNGMNWLALNAADASPGIGHHSLVAITGNRFLSTASLRGGCADRGINYSVVMVSLHGSNESEHGVVENVSISSNTFEAAFVKQAVALWSGTSRIDVQNNVIRDAGLRLPARSGELGRYAINIYDSAHEKPGLHPSDIHVVGNTIENPVSCGVYVAAGRRIEIRRNRISGQRDPYDDTLPKGAIALNHAEESSVHENELVDNHIGIDSVAGTVHFESNRVVPSAGGIRSKIWRSDHTPPEIER
ncbi:MAG TPA: right-handed parallel beta-helix repeat-containing protein [Steroidobacteraceae bacterium]|nr:right-handed parallel beta-helix repeat-containing protein [Steroidobacteraceae bacterium]